MFMSVCVFVFVYGVNVFIAYIYTYTHTHIHIHSLQLVGFLLFTATVAISASIIAMTLPGSLPLT